jgi:hypothetical protein
MTIRYVYFILLSAVLFSCTEETSEQNNSEDTTEKESRVMEASSAADLLTVETVNGEKGWGYNILKDGKPFIRQANIPSLPGNKGFDSEEKAKTVADFILYKIQNGIMPPSTNRTELDSLGVL